MTSPTHPPPLEPWDAHNQTLVGHVHPADWKNPEPATRYNLVVVGAGPAGLVAAAGAAGLGAKVALVEKHFLGGDCLNAGCVPSKALLRSARAAADVRAAAAFGIHVPPGTVADFPLVMERLRRLRAGLSRHDSARRFTELGVDVFLGTAQFLDTQTVGVGGQRLRFRRAVIATGARAVQPGIPGLAEAGFHTNETIFNLTELPRRLAVIGGGPIGCELAQAFRRLGSEVTIFHRHARLLDREDADAAAILQEIFRREGIELFLASRLVKVTTAGADKILHFESGGQSGSVAVDAILAGAGRAPNVEGLNLERAGVAFDARAGVRVRDTLQTTNPRIYAAGDVCLPDKFTHTAEAAARIVIQNALFHGRKPFSALTVPRVTYTDPEIAHVGLEEAAARERGVALDTFRHSLEQVDRAITDGETAGFVKIQVRRGTDRIVGATIVARHAGEMISEVSVAMAGSVGLKRLAGVLHPYPTQAEAIRKCADAYNRTRLTPALQKWFRRYFSWRR